MSITIDSSSKTQSVGASSAAPETGEGVETSASASQEEQDETAEGSESEDVKDDVDADEDDSEGTEEESQEKPKRKNGFKRRIDKLNSKLSKAEQEAQFWREQALKTRDGQEPQKPQSQAKPQAQGKPHPNDFETHEDWVEAVADWKADQKLAERDAKTREAQVKSEQQKVFDSHVERVKAFAEKHDDFADRMEDVDDIPVSLTVQELILGSDHGPELMYELAGNPEEFARINKLPPLQAARELGRIESRILKAQESKPKAEIKTTKAPKPLSPVGAKSGAPMKSIYDPNLSFADYEKLRREQMKSKR